MQIAVNGSLLPPQSLGAGEATYEWPVPASLLRRGYNHVTLVGPPPRSPVSVGAGSDTRPLGLAVRAFVLSRAVPE